LWTFYLLTLSLQTRNST